jgi:16S rRNA (uracil1498-N3)-methyltransferase
MELFYQENIENNQLDAVFSSEESKHIVKVLRKKNGDQISVTNGKGLQWDGEITHSNKKVIARKVNSILHKNKVPKLHIAIAPPKNIDRMEWFLEKSTEIGISQITPLICDHSERKVIKDLRMKKILIGAIKQSNQFYLPQINPICDYKKFMENNFLEIKMIAHCGKGIKEELHKIEKIQSPLLILIGPEGDFSEKEIEIARANSFIEISLGNKRLRTETAGVFACSSVEILRRTI